MQAQVSSFTSLLNGATQFVIPVFQRDYSWSEPQCEQLWNDIVRIGTADTDVRHFMGSFVYIASGDTSAGLTRWLLIDGQQRLTTLMLLLMALHEHIRMTEWVAQDGEGPVAKKLHGYFLRNALEDGDRSYKLMLRRNDQEMLAAILDGDERPAEESSVVDDNYDYFLSQMKDADPAVIYRGIKRLAVVDVTLTQGVDDPQMIFESLNSTGVDLSQADLIRNFILMRLPESEQTRLYENYWTKIEHLFRDAGPTFDSFVRDYVALKTRASKQIRSTDIYAAFRNFFFQYTGESSIDDLLQEMLEHARCHAAFMLGRGCPKKLETPLLRLKSLAEVLAIVVMRLSDAHHRLGTLSEAQFIEAIELLESHVFRRAICGLGSRGYWNTFSRIAYGLKDEDMLTSLRVALHNEGTNTRFPNNSEFTRCLVTRDIYTLRVCHYLLERLENHDTKEPSATKSLTIEHVMPQNEKVSSDWRAMLGENWKEVHETWLHRLGNLTLTGYNPEYSDRPFREKQAIPNGFKESAVRLNRSISEAEVWTEVEMEKRGRALAEKATRVWPELVVDPAAVQAAKLEALKNRAERRDVSRVVMSARARELFDLLRPRIRALHEDIIEMPESRSVSYHGSDFFVEVLPRKNRLTLLLNLDFADCGAIEEELADASEWKFVRNSRNDGGVVFLLNGASHIDAAMRRVEQAWRATQLS